ncbi:MAG: M28 family metallopeptidase [Bacteroidales bacterium]|jgi:Zn-dependent M28 family amino/carboxypeptidase|nr:M28 family metallopeptidase [Bacteroidales bacterium]NLM91363.1 M28 family peptidase [Bacteroidales bacterium]
MKKTGINGLLAIVLGLTACVSSADRDFSQAEAVISGEAMVDYIKVLASDEFRGRAPFTEGEELTINYLKGQFIELGLEPVFDGSYFQEVPLMEVEVKPADELRMQTPGGLLELQNLSEFVAFSRKVQPRTKIEDAPVVFAGYGIVAPEYGWNDYEGLDARGKIVVVLVNDPGLATGDPGLFRGNAMSYYGRWTYKYEEAARQGALGLLIVHNTRGAGYPWSVVVNGGVSPKLYLQDENGNAEFADLEGWLTTGAAEKLFAGAGMDFHELVARASQVGFRAVELNTRMWFEMESRFTYDVSRNVAGVFPGTDLGDEVIIFSAHWDHFGIGPIIDGDSIYRGAVDNGTSIAWMLEIARAFGKLEQKPRRSIMILAPTAEEQGLLGAHWYVSHPAFPLEKTVANFNNDLMLPLGRMRDVMITGFGQSTLDDLVEEAAARQDRYVVADPTPETGMYYRADHFAFAKAGVPALFARGNVEHREHGRDWMAQKEKDWLANNYHKPADKYDAETWNMEGIVEDARLAFYMSWKLARSEEWPQWKEGSEFKAVRERYMP